MKGGFFPTGQRKRSRPMERTRRWGMVVPVGLLALAAAWATFRAAGQEPSPAPAELHLDDLLRQTAQEAAAKSGGCLRCHQGARDPHFKATLRLGCADCHGGDPAAEDKE